MEEINAIKTVVKALTKAKGFNQYIHSQDKIEDKEIGLITFYSAQKEKLNFWNKMENLISIMILE